MELLSLEKDVFGERENLESIEEENVSFCVYKESRCIYRETRGWWDAKRGFMVLCKKVVDPFRILQKCSD